MESLIFTNKKPETFIGQKRVFNFLNMDSLWQFRNNRIYNKAVLRKENINFPDGRMIGGKLRIAQIRGPSFTRNLLKSKRHNGKKHFFVGGVSVEQIVKNSCLNKKQIKIYNPPFVNGIEFSEGEINKIALMLKKFKADFVWIGVGSPKQEILANQLYKKYKADYFNVGAALDFLVGNKKEAPVVWRKIGLEWFYQLIVHPKRAWRKVWRSFVALGYLKDLGVRG